MTGNIKNPTTQDIEDYWNQCNKQQEEMREQKKEEPQNHMFSSSNQTVTSPAPSRSAPSYNALYRDTPQEREEELKSQREEDRVFIQRITHQLLRVRRTIKRDIEDKADNIVIRPRMPHS